MYKKNKGGLFVPFFYAQKLDFMTFFMYFYTMSIIELIYRQIRDNQRRIMEINQELEFNSNSNKETLLSEKNKLITNINLLKDRVNNG